jgi:chromosome segregation ATPase
MRSAVLALTAVAATADETANPIGKVLEMIADLEGKIIKEGEEAHKVYADFAEFCDDRHQEIGFEIKTGKSEVEELKATIGEATAEIDSLTSQVDDLGSSIATDEKDLKEATDVRNKENADFLVVEKDLTETIDMLERAIAVIEREMAGGASFAQVKGAQGLTQALQAMVAAESISSEDGKKLTALVQTANDDKDNEAAFGAPDAAVYQSSSGGIVDTLQGLLDTATEQLDTARKTETQQKNNYDMKKQSLEDEIKFATKDLDEAKKGIAANEEKKASAEGDLDVTTKALNEDLSDLGSLHHDCLTKASAYETEQASRGEELKALATAKKIIKEATSLAQTDSFIQLISTSKGNRVVHILKHIAGEQKSAALSQLASRVQSAIRFGGAAGEDVFAKIKEMITDMIGKLEKEAEEDANQKAFCDKEMAETAAKHEDLAAEVEKLSTRLEQKEAKSTKLKEEVATLQKELAELASTQSKMDTLRDEEKTEFEQVKPELEKAVKGIQLALKTLKDYYSKNSGTSEASGSSDGIIALLETAEADFSKNLSEVVAEEQMAASTYESETKENEMTKLTKEQDVKYKTKEAASLDKAVSELKTDLEGVQGELDAVNTGWKTLKSQCVAKPETYADRKARRDAEIQGLKEAIEVLESEAALVQVKSKRLRGVKKHA